jgi:hypothetical protein
MHVAAECTMYVKLWLVNLNICYLHVCEVVLKG